LCLATPGPIALLGPSFALVTRVPMNLPFTMTVAKAASAVRQFRPKVVYPYHFSESNTQQFKTPIGTDLGIEVRLRKWY
jgi:L-ascorbate metabolism protein UlaG (beta-lactamase superfamily)